MILINSLEKHSLRVYNGRGFTLYRASFSNTDYLSGAFTMSNSLTLNSALIKIVLFSTYSRILV